MLTISKYGLELTGLQWTPVDCPTKMWVDLAEVHMELGGTVKTSRNIPFHTLLALPCSLHQKTITEPYTPSSHREMTHQFTVADFETAMLHCQAVLSLPQGCAALLQGGIVGHIAKEYLSINGVLAGLSLEVTAHCVGYLIRKMLKILSKLNRLIS